MGRHEEWCITRKWEERKSIDGNGGLEKNFKPPLAAIASSIFLSLHSFQLFLLNESLFPMELGLLGKLLSRVTGIIQFKQTLKIGHLHHSPTASISSQ